MNYYPIIIEETDNDRPDTEARSMVDTFAVARPRQVTGATSDATAATGVTRYSPVLQVTTEPGGSYFPVAFAAIGHTEMTAASGSAPGAGTAISREEALELIDRKIATIRVEVVEADITRAQNTIKAIVEQSTY